jgi:hypothetical protein
MFLIPGVISTDINHFLASICGTLLMYHESAKRAFISGLFWNYSHFFIEQLHQVVNDL